MEKRRHFFGYTGVEHDLDLIPAYPVDRLKTFVKCRCSCNAGSALIIFSPYSRA